MIDLRNGFGEFFYADSFVQIEPDVRDLMESLDWDRYEFLELQACVDSTLSGELLRLAEKEERADFYSIYGVQHPDESGYSMMHCLVDCDDPEIFSAIVEQAVEHSGGIAVTIEESQRKRKDLKGLSSEDSRDGFWVALSAG